MKTSKDYAIELFQIKNIIPCQCQGNHEICLHCNKCCIENGIQLIKDLNNLNIYLDHTLLKADTKTSDIQNHCLEANKYNFKTVCINPIFISIARQILKKTDVCTVIGFPLGANMHDVKFHEASSAIDTGAKELDMVINIGYLKEKDYQTVYDEINHVAKICKFNKVILKIIIETCLLTKEEIIKASLIIKKAGADFVKTSTGFSLKGAEPEQVKLIRSIVGPYFGVKASGGIRTREDALNMIKAGANRIGTSNSVLLINI